MLFISVFSLALIGGISYIPLFEFVLNIDEGFIPMAPSTAVSFLVTIITSIIWVNYNRQFYHYKKQATLALSIVALFGLLEVAEYFIGIDLNFENYLVPHLGYHDGIPLARMSPVTGFCFFLTSCVLLILLDQKNNREGNYFTIQVTTWIKNICTTLILLISLLFMVTYLYKSPLFYNTQDIIPMALSTSLGFLCLAAILITNDKKNYLIEQFTDLSPSATLIRFITPFTVLSVFITGLIQHGIFTLNPVNNSTFFAAIVLTLLSVMCGFMAMLVTKKLMEFQDNNNKYLHQYKSMVTLSSGMQALLNNNFVFLAVNQAYVNKLNLTIDEVVGKHFSDIFGKSYFDAEFISFAERSLAGEVIIQKKWMKCRSGHKFFIELEIAPYYQNDGNIHGIMVNARDITQLKHYQDNLEKSKVVIENSPIIAFRWRGDEDWSVDYVSSNVDLLGYQASDLLSGKVKYSEMVHPHDLPRVIREVKYFTEKAREHFSHEYRIISPSGKIFWIDDRTTVERDKDGVVTFFQGLIVDITEKKKAEIKLEQSNTLIKNVISSTPDLIYAKNSDHQYILANNAFAHYLKQPVSFLMGKTDQQLGFTNEQIKKYKIQDQEILKGNSIPISSCRSIYENKRVVDASKYPLKKENGDIDGIIYIGHDVTEHIDNIAEISIKQRELTQTIDAIFDAVITINDLGLIQSCNRATELMFGYTTDELVGKNVSLLMPNNVASQHDDYIKTHLNTGENKIIGKGRELVGINKNNTTFPLHLTIAELPENLDERKRFVGVCHDLSKTKQHEKLLNRTQKMEALGQLTGGIAHDYNNVLGVIIGYSDILKAQLKEQPILFDFVDQINQAGNRGAQLTRKLLSFSRQTPESSQESNLNDIIKSNNDVLRKTLLSVELVLNLKHDISQVNIDQNSFEDMLLNMAINAMHAMPNGGVLTLSTREATLSKDQASSFNIAQGKYVQLSIEDNGSGMCRTVQDKIFEPFFSTKGDQGSGLGLSQVYGFMKSSMGAINVYSELGEGTRFSLYFPVVKAENKIDNIKVDIDENLNLEGIESILVVDDEPQLRTLAKTILMGKGYRVLTAENGIEALKVLENNAIDLMFSDIIMPKMNGYLLAEKVQQLYPNVKILLASGFQGNPADNKIKLDEVIIEKPYENNFLLSRIRKCLDKPNVDAIEQNKPITQNVAEISSMKRLIWTDEMSIDDGGELDVDHQFMCILLNRCQDLLVVDDFHQPLQEIITELVEYTQDHFAREESAMRRCHYPYTKNHCDVHQMIVKQLSQKLNSCSDKEILLWLSTEMCEWLVDHFMVMDKPLHKYLMKNKGLEGNVLKKIAEGDDNA